MRATPYIRTAYARLTQVLMTQISKAYGPRDSPERGRIPGIVAGIPGTGRRMPGKVELPGSSARCGPGSVRKPGREGAKPGPGPGKQSRHRGPERARYCTRFAGLD